MTTTNTPAGKARYRFRYYQGVRYVAPWRPAPSAFVRCLACGRAWDDDKPTGMTPTPSGRCPFEGFRTGHNPESYVDRARRLTR